MRVQDHGDRRTGARRRAETPFETAFGPWENNVWHGTWLTMGKCAHRFDGGEGMDAYIGATADLAIK
jgi:hypothetical protein